jgi:hypothetical protein
VSRSKRTQWPCELNASGCASSEKPKAIDESEDGDGTYAIQGESEDVTRGGSQTTIVVVLGPASARHTKAVLRLCERLPLMHWPHCLRVLMAVRTCVLRMQL